MIRDATKQDFTTLLSIDNTCFPRGIAYDSAELAYFMNRQQARTLVLEDGTEIAAFLILEIQRRRRTATMITLDVRSEYRRKGYASQLLERSVSILEAEGVHAYELQVDVENAGAIALYQNYGFCVEGRIKDYYANGHDAYLMVRKLQSSAAE